MFSTTTHIARTLTASEPHGTWKLWKHGTQNWGTPKSMAKHGPMGHLYPPFSDTVDIPLYNIIELYLYHIYVIAKYIQLYMIYNI